MQAVSDDLLSLFLPTANTYAASAGPHTLQGAGTSEGGVRRNRGHVSTSGRRSFRSDDGVNTLRWTLSREGEQHARLGGRTLTASGCSGRGQTQRPTSCVQAPDEARGDSCTKHGELHTLNAWTCGL